MHIGDFEKDGETVSVFYTSCDVPTGTGYKKLEQVIFVGSEWKRTIEQPYIKTTLLKFIEDELEK